MDLKKLFPPIILACVIAFTGLVRDTSNLPYDLRSSDIKSGGR